MSGSKESNIKEILDYFTQNKDKIPEDLQQKLIETIIAMQKNAMPDLDLTKVTPKLHKLGEQIESFSSEMENTLKEIKEQKKEFAKKRRR